MPALELISGQVTAPSSTITSLTMNSGNSLTVRHAEPGSKIKMVGLWNVNQSAGILQVKSPFRHDNVNGMEFGAPATDGFNRFRHGVAPSLENQETLDIGLSGSGTSGNIEIASALIMYENLPGVQGRFISPEELANRIESYMVVQNTLSTGTSGGYSGEKKINAEKDQWKANRDYALIGYTVSARCGAVRWRGSDTGNLGVGGPGAAGNRDDTNEWFVALSRTFGQPMIPVFNAANKDSILIDAHQDENGTDVTVSSIFALLSAA